MAKFYTTTIAVALFCLFTLSLAHAPSENDDAATAAVSLPISEPTNAETESNSAAVTTVPLTEMTIRPVNRRFDVRSKRPCRHHSKFYHAMRDRAEIPYGNDMIVSSGENNDLEHGGERWWVRFHHHHHHHHDEDTDSDSDSDNEENDGRAKKMVFKRYDHGRLEDLKKMRHHLRHENHMKGGFMRRVRKFLGYYF